MPVDLIQLPSFVMPPPYISAATGAGRDSSVGGSRISTLPPLFPSQGPWNRVWAAGVQLAVFGISAMSPGGDFSSEPPAILSASAFADPKFLLFAGLTALLMGMTGYANHEVTVSRVASGDLGTIASLLRGLAMEHEGNLRILIDGLKRISDHAQLVKVIHGIHRMRHDPGIGSVVFRVLCTLDVRSILDFFLDSDEPLTKELLFVLCFLSLHQNSSAETVLSDERLFAKRYQEVDNHIQLLLERARAGEGWAVYFLLVLDRLIGWAMGIDLVNSLKQMIRDGNLQILGVIQNMDECHITKNQRQRLKS